MKIGIIAPSENEIKPILDNCSVCNKLEFSKLQFHVGTYCTEDIIAVFSGVCKVNSAIASQVLIDKFNVDLVILTGVAAALDPKVGIGDIVIGSEISYHDVSSEVLTEYHPWLTSNWFKINQELLNHCKFITEPAPSNYHFGRIVTGENFITVETKDRLVKDFSALCVDMESASVAHVCYANDIPFLAVRAISDQIDGNNHQTFLNNVMASSRSAARFVLQFIASRVTGANSS